MSPTLALGYGVVAATAALGLSMVLGGYVMSECRGTQVPVIDAAPDGSCELAGRMNAARLVRDPATGLPVVFACDAGDGGIQP